jgi:hypothetical protein
MADVDRLLAEFIRAHLAGTDPDPREYMQRVDEPDRTELADLIDSYYVGAPPRPWDPDAFSGSGAEEMTEMIDRALRGQSGFWPLLLPRLRDQARLRRSELVGRLAELLGVADREHKVASYYHQMEQGLLPSSGVSGRVLERLGEILSVTPGSLRESGRAPGIRGALADEDAVFARTAHPTPDWQLEHAEAAPPPGAAGAEREAEWDEVDRLFRGGDPP